MNPSKAASSSGNRRALPCSGWSCPPLGAVRRVTARRTPSQLLRCSGLCPFMRKQTLFIRLSNCHGNRSPARPEHLSLQGTTGTAAGSPRVKRCENPTKQQLWPHTSTETTPAPFTLRSATATAAVDGKSPGGDVLHHPPSTCFNCSCRSRVAFCCAASWVALGSSVPAPLQLQGMALLRDLGQKASPFCISQPPPCMEETSCGHCLLQDCFC